MVRLQSVAKRYGGGPEILRDVSFALAPGSFHFLTGTSGAGKTTLLSIIGLAERPSGGRITLFDIDTTRASRAERARLRRRIGTVFQDCRLADELSVADNVALPLRIDGAPEKARRDNVAALLDWLAIANRSAARPSTLSASDRQRVALARAMVRRPDLLLADEPAGAGDDDDLALLLVGAYEQMTQLGTIVLVATRDTGFAERFAHPRLHLDAGTLSSSGAAL